MFGGQPSSGRIGSRAANPAIISPNVDPGPAPSRRVVEQGVCDLRLIDLVEPPAATIRSPRGCGNSSVSRVSSAFCPATGRLTTHPASEPLG